MDARDGASESVRRPEREDPTGGQAAPFSCGLRGYLVSQHLVKPWAEPAANASDWEAQWKSTALEELKVLNPFTRDWLRSAWMPVKQCTQVAPRDHVEISPLGKMLDGIGQLPEIRHERVDEIRRQIAAGSYETPEKLELALDRMLDEMMGW